MYMLHILIHNLTDTYGPHVKKGIQGREATIIYRLVNRSVHLGLTGDIVVVSPQIPSDFIDYIQKVTGQLLVLVTADFPSESGPITTKQLLDPLRKLHGQNFLLDPYVQSATIAQFSEEVNIPLAYTSAEHLKNGLTLRANDKAHFREVAPKLRIPTVEDQTTISITDTKNLEVIMHKLLDKYGGTFIQANLSAGGDGNIDIHKRDDKTYHSKLGTDLTDITEKLFAWAKLMKEEGCDKVILAPYLTLFETYTVSGFIPKEGEPYIFGIFKQLVNESGDYRGFTFPARGKYVGECDKPMRASAKNWLDSLQKEGYVGPSNLDFIIGHNKRLGKVLAASESNTRWDGFRFALQHGARIAGWDLRTLSGISGSQIAIKAVDYVPTSFATTTELVQRLQEKQIPLLGYTDQKQGVVIMLPPEQTEKSYKTALAVIGQNSEVVEKLFDAAQESIQ